MPPHILRAFDEALKIITMVYESATPYEYDKKIDGITTIVGAENGENKKFYAVNCRELTQEEVEKEINRIGYSDAVSGVDAKDAMFQMKHNKT